MALTKVDVANGALIKLGVANPLLSLNDGTKEANLCKNRIEACKTALLRYHPWNFAIKRTTLANLAAAPAFGYSYQAQLPSDFLRVVQVDDRRTSYRIEGGKLLSDETAIELRYVYNFGDDYAAADPLFMECLTLWLANDIAIALTSDTSIKDRVAQELQMALNKARFVDATEEPAEELSATGWTDARTGGDEVMPSTDLL